LQSAARSARHPAIWDVGRQGWRADQSAQNTWSPVGLDMPTPRRQAEAEGIVPPERDMTVLPPGHALIV